MFSSRYKPYNPSWGARSQGDGINFHHPLTLQKRDQHACALTPAQVSLEHPRDSAQRSTHHANALIERNPLTDDIRLDEASSALQTPKPIDKSVLHSRKQSPECNRLLYPGTEPNRVELRSRGKPHEDVRGEQRDRSTRSPGPPRRFHKQRTVRLDAALRQVACRGEFLTRLGPNDHPDRTCFRGFNQHDAPRAHCRVIIHVHRPQRQVSSANNLRRAIAARLPALREFPQVSYHHRVAFDLNRWLPHFPVRESCLYLDHATLCPLPQPVAQAMRDRIEAQERWGGADSDRWLQNALTCRHLGAELVGVAPEDISLIRSTSEGLSLIAGGLAWQSAEEILVGEEEFAANVAPWLALEDRGVKVIRYRQPTGRTDVDCVAQLIGPRTRLLAVSWVSFHSGWVAPLAQLGGLCREHGAHLVVDGIQGLGVLPMDLKTLGVDALVADAHKWLLGPEGIGLMATRPALRTQIRPALSGWRNVHLEPGDYFLDQLAYSADGRRFEPGTTNEVGVAGLAAALDLGHQIGYDVIQTRIEMLVRNLLRILIAHGWEVFSPGPGHPVAGIVSARHPGVEPKEAVRRLVERHIICSARQGYVRFSPHFYTTRGELEAFDRILEKVGL